MGGRIADEPPNTAVTVGSNTHPPAARQDCRRQRILVMTAEASRPFAAAVSHLPDWQANAADLARQLAGAPGQLGVLYCSGGLADHLAQMCDLLKRDSGITEWVAATGYGVITGDDEHFGEVAATAMVL